MRTALLLGVLASSATASAAPCKVDFVRAPEEVQAEIEKWVAQEPSCASSLELRVVPTTDGLYLLARRADGRMHERVVPDAQTAGVLVASWVAEDPNVAPPPAPPPAPVYAPPPLTVNPFATAPGATEVHAEAPAPTTRPLPRWISAGLLGRSAGRGGWGIRAELDVIAKRGWTVGVAVGYSEGGDDVWLGSEMGSLWSQDLRAVATVAHTWVRGRWQLRGWVGLGAMRSQIDTHGYDGGWMPIVMSGSGEFITAEAGATVTRRLGERWAIAAGPLVTVFDQEYANWDGSGAGLSRSAADISWFGGLRRRM